MITAAYTALTCTVAVMFPDIAKVLQIMGGLCSTTMCYLIPVYCYVKLNGLSKCHFLNISPMIFFCLLGFIGYMSVFVTIYSIIYDVDYTHFRE